MNVRTRASIWVLDLEVAAEIKNGETKFTISNNRQHDEWEGISPLEVEQALELYQALGELLMWVRNQADE